MPGLGLLTPALGSSLGVFSSLRGSVEIYQWEGTSCSSLQFYFKTNTESTPASSPHRIKQHSTSFLTQPHFLVSTSNLPITYSTTTPQHNNHLPLFLLIPTPNSSFCPFHFHISTPSLQLWPQTSNLFPSWKARGRFSGTNRTGSGSLKIWRDSGGLSKVARCENWIEAT
jgi:hypothetical protein